MEQLKKAQEQNIPKRLENTSFKHRGMKLKPIII